MHHLANMYFLDSTVLVHAADSKAQYHEECLCVLTKAAKGQIRAATSFETLEETLFVLSKQVGKSKALCVVHDLLDMSKIAKYDMDSSIFTKALELLDTTSLKGPKDAINVATMLENGIKTIISEDADYDKVNLIQRIHPKDLP